MGSKVCGTPEMMGGWPGAPAALSHLRLDSEGWESDGGLPHRGDVLAYCSSPCPGAKAQKKITSRQQVTVGKQLVLIISQNVFASSQG